MSTAYKRKSKATDSQEEAFSATTSNTEKTYDKSKHSDDDYSSWTWSCYWPLIIFIFLFIIIIIALFCSGFDDGKHGNKTGTIAYVILFFIIWTIIIGYFCRSGDLTAAWFFLLLFIAIIFIWWIASKLACIC
jgi:lipopolysaccharide export LptBFGC system permease protein LptF